MKTSKIINEVKSIILQHAKPSRIYLYGSYVNGDATPTSDIDIAFDDKNCDDIYIIKDKVEKIETLVKIDITNIAKTCNRFRNRIISTGKVIFSATKQLRAEDALFNFSYSLDRFSEIVDSLDYFKEKGIEDMYLDIIVKRFEFTYEMAWKTLRRYLIFLGFDIKHPREAFKEGYAQAIITDENIWLDMIEQRNLSAHVYDEFQIREILAKTKEYNQAFNALKNEIEKHLFPSKPASIVNNKE